MSWNNSTTGAAEWNSGPTADNFNDGFDAPSGGTFGASAAYDFATNRSDGFGGAGFGGIDDLNVGSGGADGHGCRNCGEEGHFARECPQPRKQTGPCFNCGEVGHSKVDCTQPRVFKGVCRICEQEGHPASECPQKPPPICRNCGTEGHEAFGCEAKKALPMHHVADKVPEEAWDDLKRASDEREITDFKEAVQVLVKAVPEITYAELENEFRKRGFNVYLIAMEKEIESTQTIVNLQGKIGCKYAVFYFLSDKPQRPNMKARWPQSAQDNLQRLLDAGVTMDSGVVKCNNCNELGHTTRKCPQEREVIDRTEVKCFLCDQPGHRVRDCKEDRPQARSRECKICAGLDHLARDCPDKPAQTCRNCGSEEHMAKECDKPRPCNNCDQTGHQARECTAPKDWSRVTCRNCGEKGHTIKRCPQPIKDEADAQAGGDGNIGSVEASWDAGGGDWEKKTAAADGDDWGNNASGTPAFGVGPPIAATSGW